MKRGPTGEFEISSTSGEKVRAFVPKPLPPVPPVAFGGTLHASLEAATLALGRLDSLSTLLPHPDLFLYTYVRKEAVLSSQIEGTQSTLSDLLLFEVAEAPGVPVNDAVEASNYVAALEHGIGRLRSGFPLSNRLIREIHAVLLAKGRGSEKEPGEFRRSQNWIGGTRPGNASFVPPPPHRVPACMSELERFLHQEAGMPVVLQAALAHVQFETIHPFLDGNGRIGRVLITLLLCHAGLLQEPLLYLSLYLKQNRAKYYGLLDRVRSEGDWEAWISFFLDGVRETAEGAVTTARRIVSLFDADRKNVQGRGKAAGSALRIHEGMKRRPVTTLRDLTRVTGLSYPAVSDAMELLSELRIVRELTGKKRNRVFGYAKYIEILGEGTEPQAFTTARD